MKRKNARFFEWVGYSVKFGIILHYSDLFESREVDTLERDHDWAGLEFDPLSFRIALVPASVMRSKIDPSLEVSSQNFLSSLIEAEERESIDWKV